MSEPVALFCFMAALILGPPLFVAIAEAWRDSQESAGAQPR